MAYASQADLEKLITPAVLVQLADDNGDGVADTAVITEALAWADDQINAYCGLRFQVPFAPVPGIINKTAIDLALYHLHTRRSNADVPQVRKDRYDDARRFLEGVAAGRLSLGVQPSPAEDTSRQDDVAKTRAETDRTFTIGKPSDGAAGTLDRF